LASRFGVSRSTVRRALASLRAQCVLTSQQGSRSKVIDPHLRNLRFLWIDRDETQTMQEARRRIFDPLSKCIINHGAVMDFWHLPMGEGHRQSELWLLEHLMEYNGIAVSNFDASDISGDLAKRFREHGNVVSMVRTKNNLADVVVDMNNTTAGYEVARLLDAAGLRRVALVGISTGLNTEHFHERVNGFMNYWMDHATPAISPIIVLSSNRPDFNSPEQLLREVLAQKPQPEALFCVTDILAWRCIDVLHAMHLRVPQDISVVGYDNTDLGSEPSAIPLTTIGAPCEAIVDGLWHALLENADRPRGHASVYPPVKSCFRRKSSTAAVCGTSKSTAELS